MTRYTILAMLALLALLACPAPHRPVLAWDPMDDDTEGCWCGNTINCGPGDLSAEDCEE